MQPTSVLLNKSHGVGYITFNRPKKRNALNTILRSEIMGALKGFDRDRAVRCIVIHGAGEAFAAGADIQEMHSLTYTDLVAKKFFSEFDDFNQIEKYVIAAVHGSAMGGGFELAMMCDEIVIAEGTILALLEITLGTHPGIGGTQRLPIIVGKSKAMEWTLTGKKISAMEAFENGIASRVVPLANFMDEVGKMARDTSDNKPLKKQIKRAREPSPEKIAAERRSFYSTFKLRDRFEGMDAFVNKRTASWSHE